MTMPRFDLVMRDKALEHEETLSSIVTIRLMCLAGIAWAARFKKTFAGLLDPYRELLSDKPFPFWDWLHELTQRGVDVHNPLAPFEAR
jgi:hypothetical protein